MTDEPRLYADPVIEPDDEAPEQPAATADDPGATKKAKRKAKRWEDEAAEFWRNVFSTRVGRRAMWEMIEQSGFNQVKFGMSGVGLPDEQASWFAYGQHEYGRLLYDGWAMRMPVEVALMRAENDTLLPAQFRKQVIDG